MKCAGGCDREHWGGGFNRNAREIVAVWCADCYRREFPGAADTLGFVGFRNGWLVVVGSDADAKYAREHGPVALERQRTERGERHPCCGEPIAVGHHQMCSKRRADELPAHVEGQEALL